MTEGARLEHLEEDLRYVRERVDGIDATLTQLLVSMEHRITKIETKATIFGAAFGAVAGAIASFLGFKLGGH